ncbi:FlgD immunoglobulin-like domain containing protein [candidate division KSB1 bacterium]
MFVSMLFVTITAKIPNSIIAFFHSRRVPLFLLAVIVLLSSGSPGIAWSQAIRPSIYSMEGSLDNLPSNYITDILIINNDAWLGTGRGLSKTTDSGRTFTNFSGTPGIGRGATSALTYDSGVLWIAAGYDTLISDEYLQAGGGLSWSDDYGATWHYIPQPVDPNDEDSLGYKPTTTHVQNITFDIAVHNGEVWITSKGGGLRKSADNGLNWEVVTPDRYPFEPLKYLNHRAFAVISADNGLWVGTAQGVNKSTDGGGTWTNYSAQNSGVSGNFITALGKQETGQGTIIWAASWKAEGEEEFYGVSRTTNGGLTWESMLEGERSHNFGFNGDEVYTVTDNGLFKSYDRGENWGNFPWITSPDGDQFLTTEYYSVAVGSGLLWTGTSDGLATSSDGGSTWSIIRSFREPGIDGTPKVYAYPNPFSPLRHNLLGEKGHVRIQYSIDNAAEISLSIFDYGMNPVKTVVSGKSRFNPGSYAEAWDGTNNWGQMVANGVYFYKMEISGEGTFWGKIIVMN